MTTISLLAVHIDLIFLENTVNDGISVISV